MGSPEGLDPQPALREEFPIEPHPPRCVIKQNTASSEENAPLDYLLKPGHNIRNNGNFVDRETSMKQLKRLPYKGGGHFLEISEYPFCPYLQSSKFYSSCGLELSHEMGIIFTWPICIFLLDRKLKYQFVQFSPKHMAYSPQPKRSPVRRMSSPSFHGGLWPR